MDKQTGGTGTWVREAYCVAMTVTPKSRSYTVRLAFLMFVEMHNTRRGQRMEACPAELSREERRRLQLLSALNRKAEAAAEPLPHQEPLVELGQVHLFFSRRAGNNRKTSEEGKRMSRLQKKDGEPLGLSNIKAPATEKVKEEQKTRPSAASREMPQLATPW